MRGEEGHTRGRHLGSLTNFGLCKYVCGGEGVGVRKSERRSCPRTKAGEEEELGKCRREGDRGMVANDQRAAGPRESEDDCVE